MAAESENTKRTIDYVKYTKIYQGKASTNLEEPQEVATMYQQDVLKKLGTQIVEELVNSVLTNEPMTEENTYKIVAIIDESPISEKHKTLLNAMIAGIHVLENAKHTHDPDDVESLKDMLQTSLHVASIAVKFMSPGMKTNTKYALKYALAKPEIGDEPADDSLFTNGRPNPITPEFLKSIENEPKDEWIKFNP